MEEKNFSNRNRKGAHRWLPVLALVALIISSLACSLFVGAPQESPPQQPAVTQARVQGVQTLAPTFTPAPENTPLPESSQNTGPANPAPSSTLLIQLHDRLNPGVVNINVIVSRQGQFGQGAGSGFIIDDQGHIVTNNHVIEGATQVTVVFFNGFESEAQVIGADPDSDLAVVQVNNVPNNAHPLELGDSDKVQVGEWVIAIGNPFGQTSSMTVGIVSATGRLLESGVANYSIPQGIQTDAAINPGNSGGPLLNMLGEVIGVNAQIQTGGVAANAGVGFAIPSNVVRHVVPTLIQEGVFQWPYLGVSGGPVNLFIAQANNLQTQQGAYIDSVTPGGPAAQAGLRGTQSTTQEGIPVGGDVVVAANGQPINSFQDLLAVVAFSRPGDTLDLTIVRNSQQRNVTVTLAPRP